MPSSHATSSRVSSEGSQMQRSGKIAQFERQVALPAPVTETEKQQHSQQSTQHASSVGTSTASAKTTTSNSGVPSVSVSTAGGSSLNININQRPASVGSDGLNFDQSNSYNKPNYNDANNFKYHNDGSSDSHFHNQYPPSVEEPQGGYGGYFQPSSHNAGGQETQFYNGNGGYDHSQLGGQGYLPPETVNQRPVVTKTIQIAQPAIKTKKYEVRHPAIQKEFYDIEERVVIKPAGTVVVELERPVAKIPKGESILPLGHPHPAVANAYMNNGNTPAFSNIIYSAAGSSNQGNQANKQYPHGYNSKQSNDRSTISGSTIASSITSTPSFDQGTKVMAVEANLNKQYNGENHYSATAAPVTEDPKLRSREVIVVTDGQGNQRQVSSDRFPYSQTRSGYNLRSYSNQNVAPQRPSNVQSISSNREPYNFDAEYVNVGAIGNIARDSKPARLEEAPIRMEPVIKHGHSIALPASQHKIYLTQKYAVPQTQYVEENAHVQEVTPHHLINRKGPVVVYATSKHRPEVSFRQSGSAADYQPHTITAGYRSSSAVAEKSVGSSRLEISAPYAQMRYNSDERSTINNYAANQNLGNDRENHKFGRLITEEKNAKEGSSISNASGGMNTTRMEGPQTHIEINIPESSQSSNKPITVSSTIRPMMSDDGKATHNAKLEISVTNNGEPKKDEMPLAEDISSKEIRDREYVTSSQDSVDCDKTTKMDSKQADHKLMRLVEAPSESHDSSSETSSSSSTHQPTNVDVTNKGSSGHVISSGHSGHAATPGSRVIAATPAPRDSTAGSESFHKRRIVVNHPFQTVREVVEHEPYTNYHEVQVSEPASPALYHSAAYFRSHGALRQAPTEERHIGTPIFYNWWFQRTPANGLTLTSSDKCVHTNY